MRKPSSSITCFAIAALLLVGLVMPSAAQQAAAPGRLRLDLQGCIERALQHNAEIKEARIKIITAESFSDEANAARFPSIELMAFGGPSPEARGDVMSPRDDRARVDLNNAGHIGVFGRLDLMIIQPLYTFGKISNLRAAAKLGIAADRAKADQTAAEVIREVKEFYYGLLFAREMEEVIEELEGIFEDALDNARKLVEAERGAATDVLRLQVAQVVVKDQKLEVKKSIDLARSALAHKIGIDRKVDFDIADGLLKPQGAALLDLNSYIAMAVNNRPELRQLAAGLGAREHLVESELSDYWPRVFLAAGARAGGSTSFERQTNPFAYDPFNFLDAFVTLGVQWDLGILRNRAQVKRARSELNQLLAKQEFANTGIPLEVKKAYLEAKQARENVTNFRRGIKLARGLLALESSNYNFGLKEARELIDALVAFATNRKSFFESIYRYNLALAELSRTVGKEVTDLTY